MSKKTGGAIRAALRASDMLGRGLQDARRDVCARAGTDAPAGPGARTGEGPRSGPLGTRAIDNCAAVQQESGCGWEGCLGGPLSFWLTRLHFSCTARLSPRYPMHLLYLDDSGAVGNANEQYLVLGGVSVFEAQVYWINTEVG